MFEELIMMGIFLLVSVAISYILLNKLPSPLNKIFRTLAIAGIVIHELCHLVMCVITNASVKNVKLLERVRMEPETDKFKYRYGGRIEVDGEKKLTFLQALLIGLAPLLFSFWLFFFLWNLILTTIVDAAIFFLVIFVMISIFLSAAPSAADLICIPRAFQDDPKYSAYQTLLLVVSIILVWFVVAIYQLVFFHEIVTYVLIMITYYGIKYVLKGFNLLVRLIFSNNDVQAVQNAGRKPYMRRRYKPEKPKKLGFEETHW